MEWFTLCSIYWMLNWFNLIYFEKDCFIFLIYLVVYNTNVYKYYHTKCCQLSKTLFSCCTLVSEDKTMVRNILMPTQKRNKEKKKKKNSLAQLLGVGYPNLSSHVGLHRVLFVALLQTCILLDRIKLRICAKHINSASFFSCLATPPSLS